MAKLIDPSVLVAEYESKRNAYIAFTKSLRQLIRDLLSSAHVEVMAIEGRTKTRKSLSEKVRREDKLGKYATLSDITDLSGIRIIAFLREDCEKICKLIRDNFEVDELNSIDKTLPDEVDKFGYSSQHIVAGLNDRRLKLPEFSEFRELKAEFQIRTVLQHAWAVLDWQFRYKSTDEAPAEIRRKLYRISAFLEGADENFSEVHDAVLRIREEYKAKVERGDLDIRLNADSLAEFFRNSSVISNMMSAYAAHGYKVTESSLTPEGLSRALEYLDILNIETLADLERQLLSVQHQPAEVAQRLNEAFAEIMDVHGGVALSIGGAIRVTLLANASEEDFEKYAAPLLDNQTTIDVIRRTREKLKAVA